MTSQQLFSLESWIETHESPYVVIDNNLQISAVNTVGEHFFGLKRSDLMGKPCCQFQGKCRHQAFFDRFEPYAGYFAAEYSAKLNKRQYWVKGNVIQNANGVNYIGEMYKVLDAKESQSLIPLMVGISPVFLKLQAKLQQVANTNVPVLLTGETGTGKEVTAHFIHQHSQRAKGDLVVVDCTLLNENLCESELFGHEKGAFTNALTQKKGLFELANNGTLFLDEVGELPLSQQPKLLRALESGQFRRVGGTKSLSSDVRVICATHRHLSEMVKAGTFREDLFYRLSVLSVEVPPLRERKQDLPLLSEYLLQMEGHELSLTQQALTKLLQHSWPGNIRELKNCLQLAVALAGNKQIDKQDIQILRRRTRPFAQVPADAHAHTPISRQNVHSAESEKELISQLILKYQGNRKDIAAEIGISERTLYRKLNTLKI